MSRESQRRSRARKKAREVFDWYSRYAVTREDLQYKLGLSRSEADAVYRYFVEAEKGVEEYQVSRESGTALRLPVSEEGVFDALLSASERSVNPDLPLAAVDEAGVHFETGVPVEFDFLRSTEPAPYLGEKYQQDIEPAGRYMLLRGPWSTAEPQPGWEYGRIRFDQPLVLLMNTNADPEFSFYNETSWKALLSGAYGGKTGKALSRALLQDGYDGIVTVGTDSRGRPRDTREIVDLTVLKRRALKQKLLR